tara:strand:+ start:2033 stop:2251 length:219 start_codon:yes stop_codon:yes gene_type:complete
MKVGDLVTMDPYCAPPELYGLGIITGITLKNTMGEPMRARIYWSGSRDWKGEDASPRVGNCAVKYLHKVEAK